MKLIRIPSGDGEVRVAVRTSPHDVTPVGALDEAVEKVERSLDEALGAVTRVASAFCESLRPLSDPLDSAELELGLQFTAKGTIYVVESTGEASLKVKLVFKPGQASFGKDPSSAAKAVSSSE